MKAHKIIIKTRSKKYPILVGSNIIKNFSEVLLSNKIKSKKCLIIIDKKIPSKLKFDLNIILIEMIMSFHLVEA